MQTSSMWSFSRLTGILLFTTLLMPSFAEARHPRGGGPGQGAAQTFSRPLKADILRRCLHRPTSPHCLSTP